MAGLLTDLCLFHSAVSAVNAGYEVLVVADASATTTSLADSVTYARLDDTGIGISAVSTYGILFELYHDLGTEEGQRAEAVAGASLS